MRWTLLVLTALLIGCGSSGGEGSPATAPPPADSTPDSFNFSPQLNVSRDSVITSEEVTVTGINVEVQIRVVGGEYSINGGEYTDLTGTVEQGQSVATRHTSASGYEEITTTTLFIGGVQGSFQSTTESLPVVEVVTPTITYLEKTFQFDWNDHPNATHYKLFEDPDGESGYSQIGSDIPQGVESYSHRVPLFARQNARYLFGACNEGMCAQSNLIERASDLSSAIGYIKASNADQMDRLGWSIDFSENGDTLAAGTPYEASCGTGVNGDQSSNDCIEAGAVYIFVLENGAWVQEAYLKASDTQSFDRFGESLSLSSDGNTIAVGSPSPTALNERSAYIFTRNADGWQEQSKITSPINPLGRFGTSVSLSADGNSLAVGDTLASDDNSLISSGGVYIFSRTDGNWALESSLFASNPDQLDSFGTSVALSAAGSTLAVGAPHEDSPSSDQSSNDLRDAGAIYIFAKNGDDWEQRAYLKASNPQSRAVFGIELSISANGEKLVATASRESSSSTGVNGDQLSIASRGSGAAYLFEQSNNSWVQTIYLKPSNTHEDMWFGTDVSMSADGNLIAIGASQEGGASFGIDGDDTLIESRGSGAVYVFKQENGETFQSAYLKASNNGLGDSFGASVALSDDGKTLGVLAGFEDGGSKGPGGDQESDDSINSGAIYTY